MCFSAGASFTSAGILTILGILSIKKAPREYRLFAMMPLFFAIQQYCEGIIWLIMEGFEKATSSGIFTFPLAIIAAPLGLFAKALDLAHYYNAIKTIAMYGFLFFALIIWPFWIPCSCLQFEHQKSRITLLHIFLFIGQDFPSFCSVIFYCMALP